MEKKLWELRKNAKCYFEQILEAAPQKTAAGCPLTSHLKNHPSNTSHHAGYCWRSKEEPIGDVLYGPEHIELLVLANQQELIYISSVRPLDVVWKTLSTALYDRDG